MQDKRKSRLAFTLIETLIVVSMIAVITLAVSALLRSGLTVWQRANQPFATEDLGLFLSKLSKDTSCVFMHSTLAFSGNETGMILPAAVALKPLNSEAPGLITYGFDRQNMTITRASQDYSDVYEAKKVNRVAVLNGLRDARFSFYYYNNTTDDYSWSVSSEGNKIPVAVRLELEFDQGTGLSNTTNTFFFPVGAGYLDH